MDRRQLILAAFASATATLVGAQAMAAEKIEDLPADGAIEVKKWGGGHGGWGPPGHARGWGRGNSAWAATRGRKRGWYKHRRRGW